MHEKKTETRTCNLTITSEHPIANVYIFFTAFTQGTDSVWDERFGCSQVLSHIPLVISNTSLPNSIKRTTIEWFLMMLLAENILTQSFLNRDTFIICTFPVLGYAYAGYRF